MFCRKERKNTAGAVFRGQVANAAWHSNRSLQANDWSITTIYNVIESWWYRTPTEGGSGGERRVLELILQCMMRFIVFAVPVTTTKTLWMKVLVEENNRMLTALYQPFDTRDLLWNPRRDSEQQRRCWLAYRDEIHQVVHINIKFWKQNIFGKCWTRWEHRPTGWCRTFGINCIHGSVWNFFKIAPIY